MKLSIEAKVAAAVAAGFVALTVGTIAQGNSSYQPGPVSNAGVTNYMSQEEYNSSKPGRRNAAENRHRSSAEHERVSTNSGKETKILKARKHHTQHFDQSHRTEMNEPAG